jgi:hypothetical protein
VVFYLVGGIAQRKNATVFVYAEVLIRRENKIDYSAYFVFDLLGRYEKVRVVLAKMPSAFDTLERAARLKPKVVRYFAYT